MYLCDAVQAAILFVEAPCNHVVPSVDEGKWKLPDPVHNLAPVLAGSILHNIDLRNHGILQKRRHCLRFTRKTQDRILSNPTYYKQYQLA